MLSTFHGCFFVCSFALNLKHKKMKTLQDVYLSQEAFDKDLEECLTIIDYPSKRKPYYVCEHISVGLHKRKVNVYINK